MEVVKIIAGAVFVALLGFIAATYWYRRNRKDKQLDTQEDDRKRRAVNVEEKRQGRAARIEESAEVMKGRITALEAEIAALKAQAAPINAVVQTLLIKGLTHFHTPTMDALMVKLGDERTPPTLTEAEEEKLLQALKERSEDMGNEISDDERDDAEMLPIIMRKRKREAKRLAQGEKYALVQVVGVLPTGENE